MSPRKKLIEVAGKLVYRHDEARLEIAEAGRPWRSIFLRDSDLGVTSANSDFANLVARAETPR